MDMPFAFLPQCIATPLLSLRIIGFATQILAYMLDSLVRVSRRVDRNHLVRINIRCKWKLYPVTSKWKQYDIVIEFTSPARSKVSCLVAHHEVPQSKPQYSARTITDSIATTLPFPTASPAIQTHSDIPLSQDPLIRKHTALPELPTGHTAIPFWIGKMTMVQYTGF
jgi:hypothetical protein